ncbi:MAG: TlpA family protein disulfide reductase, partial [Dehalococcoidia bacterium]
PLLVVFSSPAFCTSPNCGPQVDTVSEVKERHRNRTDFIHVEVYDNPHEVQGDLSNGRYSPVVEAWGLTQIEGYLNESWTFVLDGEGRITAKFEGFATAEELEEALLQVEQPQAS